MTTSSKSLGGAVLAVLLLHGSSHGQYACDVSANCPPVNITLQPKNIVVKGCRDEENDCEKKGCWLLHKCKSKSSSAPSASPAMFMTPIVYSPAAIPFPTQTVIHSTQNTVAPTSARMNAMLAAQQAEVALAELEAERAAQRALAAATDETIRRIQDRLGKLRSDDNDSTKPTTGNVDLSGVLAELKKLQDGQEELRGRLINSAGVNQAIGERLVKVEEELRGRVINEAGANQAIGERLVQVSERLNALNQRINEDFDPSEGRVTKKIQEILDRQPKDRTENRTNNEEPPSSPPTNSPAPATPPQPAHPPAGAAEPGQASTPRLNSPSAERTVLENVEVRPGAVHVTIEPLDILSPR